MGVEGSTSFRGQSFELPHIQPQSNAAAPQTSGVSQSNSEEQFNHNVCTQLQTAKFESVGSAGGHGGNSIATVTVDNKQVKVFLKPFPKINVGTKNNPIIVPDKTEYNNYETIKSRCPGLLAHMPKVYGTVEKDGVEYLVMQNTRDVDGKKLNTIADAKLSGGGHAYGLIATNKEVEKTRKRTKGLGTIIQQEIGARIAPNFMVSREGVARHMRIFEYPSSDKNLKETLKDATPEQLAHLSTKLGEIKNLMYNDNVALIGASIIIMKDEEGNLTPLLIDPAHMAETKETEHESPALTSRYIPSDKEFMARKLSNDLSMASIMNVVSDAKTAKESPRLRTESSRRQSIVPERIKVGARKFSGAISSIFSKTRTRASTMLGGKDRTQSTAEPQTRVQSSPAELQRRETTESKVETTETSVKAESDPKVDSSIKELKNVKAEKYLDDNQIKALGVILSKTPELNAETLLNNVLNMNEPDDLDLITAYVPDEKQDANFQSSVDFIKSEHSQIQSQVRTRERENVSNESSQTQGAYKGDYSAELNELVNEDPNLPQQVINDLSVILANTSFIGASFLLQEYQSTKYDDINTFFSTLVPNPNGDALKAIQKLTEYKLFEKINNPNS